MSGRLCHKEEVCCRKAKAAIEAFEASVAKGDFNERGGEHAREEQRDIIDRFLRILSAAQERYYDSIEEDDA